MSSQCPALAEFPFELLEVGLFITCARAQGVETSELSRSVDPRSQFAICHLARQRRRSLEPAVAKAVWKAVLHWEVWFKFICPGVVEDITLWLQKNHCFLLFRECSWVGSIVGPLVAS